MGSTTFINLLISPTLYFATSLPISFPHSLYLTLGCPILSSLKLTIPFYAKGFLLHIDDTLCLRAFPGQACWGVNIPALSQKLPTHD